MHQRPVECHSRVIDQSKQRFASQQFPDLLISTLLCQHYINMLSEAILPPLIWPKLHRDFKRPATRTKMAGLGSGRHCAGRIAADKIQLINITYKSAVAMYIRLEMTVSGHGCCSIIAPPEACLLRCPENVASCFLTKNRGQPACCRGHSRQQLVQLSTLQCTIQDFSPSSGRQKCFGLEKGQGVDRTPLIC